jgi:hypothetical protein
MAAAKIQDSMMVEMFFMIMPLLYSRNREIHLLAEIAKWRVDGKRAISAPYKSGGYAGFLGGFGRVSPWAVCGYLSQVQNNFLIRLDSGTEFSAYNFCGQKLGAGFFQLLNQSIRTFRDAASFAIDNDVSFRAASFRKNRSNAIFVARLKFFMRYVHFVISFAILNFVSFSILR